MIRLRGIGKTYRTPAGDELRVLDGLDLDAVPGRVVVVLGPNGRGKTTLLRI
jgi:ABC-type multidrug transport system ATPase subunit